jgi:hypothetical protein
MGMFVISIAAVWRMGERRAQQKRSKAKDNLLALALGLGALLGPLPLPLFLFLFCDWNVFFSRLASRVSCF